MRNSTSIRVNAVEVARKTRARGTRARGARAPLAAAPAAPDRRRRPSAASGGPERPGTFFSQLVVYKATPWRRDRGPTSGVPAMPLLAASRRPPRGHHDTAFAPTPFLRTRGTNALPFHCVQRSAQQDLRKESSCCIAMLRRFAAKAFNVNARY